MIATTNKFLMFKFQILRKEQCMKSFDIFITLRIMHKYVLLPETQLNF